MDLRTRSGLVPRGGSGAGEAAPRGRRRLVNEGYFAIAPMSFCWLLMIVAWPFFSSSWLASRRAWFSAIWSNICLFLFLQLFKNYLKRKEDEAKRPFYF